MAEQVTIKINVKADFATIERVRAQLKSLCREADDCGETFKKYTKSLDDAGKGHRRLGEDNDKHKKKLDMLSKTVNGARKGFSSLAKFGLKYVAIEAAAAFAVIGSAAILFKTGAALVKGYQMALAGVGYALTALVAAGSAFLAVQQQFASVQFAPMFQQGLVNTKDRFEAADLAMRAFVNSSELSVFGTKALTASFAEMAKNLDPSKLGMATGAMRTLGNVAAGMGGDIGKNFGEVSKFAAAFAKEGKLTDAVKKQGEGLSPIFKKVIEEQSKAGNTTYEKFMAGLATNKTFQDAYAGQLDAVNNTVMGRIKGAFTDIKAMLTDMGGPLLSPIGDAVTKIKHMIEALLMRVRGTVTEVGSGSLLSGLVNGIEKVTLLMGNLMTRDVGNASAAMDSMKNAWHAITVGFEKIQDYLRPLQDAASVLWKTIKPILGAFTGNLNSSIQMLSTSLVKNEARFVKFGNAIGAFLKSVGQFSTSVKNAFIRLMTPLGEFIQTLGKTFELVGKSLENASPILKRLVQLSNILLKTFNLIYAVVDKLGGGLASLALSITMLTGLGKLKGGMFAKPFDLVKGGVAKRIASRKALEAATAGGTGAAAAAAARSAKLARLGAAAKGKAGKIVGAAGLYAAGAYGANKVGTMGGGMFKDDSVVSRAGGTGVGILGGAAVGAGTGAALGALGGPLAPFTAAAGAIGGAVIGGIIGGVSGFFGSGRGKKQAAKAARKFFESFTDEVNEAFANGDVETLLGLKSDFQKKAAEAKKGNEDAYNAEFFKMQKEIEALGKQIDNFVTNAQQLGKYLGIDGDKMNELAEKFNFDFKNGVYSVFEVIRVAGKDLGVDLAGFFKNVLDQIHQKQTSLILDLIDKPGQMREAGVQLDAAQAALQTGDVSEKALDEYVKQQFAYSSLISGGDPIKALKLTTDFIQNNGGKGQALEGNSGKLMERLEAMGLTDGSALAGIAEESGSLDLLVTELKTVNGGDPKTKDNLLNQINNGGATTALLQEQLLKAYSAKLITPEQFVQAGTTLDDLLKIMEPIVKQPSYDNSYPGSGVNLSPAAIGSGDKSYLFRGGVGPSGIPGEFVSPNASPQYITIGETKVTVSGILSPSDADKIAQAVAGSRLKALERTGSAEKLSRTP